MNAAHLHLLVTHLPIFGSVFGLALLLVALIRRDGTLLRTSFWILILGAAVAAPTYLTGKPANAELARFVPSMSADPSDQHAEVAMLALASAGVLGFAAAAALFRSRQGRNLPPMWVGAVLGLALLTSVLMGWTGRLGGGIRHPEIFDQTPAIGAQ